MPPDLTPIQLSVYLFILYCFHGRMLPPTYEEIAENCYISNAYANTTVVILDQKGYVTHIPRIARGIRIKKAPASNWVTAAQEKYGKE